MTKLSLSKNHLLNTPKVSIIMPSLNVHKYIRECLESVVSQSLEDIEIICIDAGSTDGTLEIIEEYAEKDSRISVVHSEVKSYGYQMNLGFRLARGEYIGVVETDDYVLHNMYQFLYDIAVENDADAVKSDHMVFLGNEDERKFYYRAIHNSQVYYNKVFRPLDEMPFFFVNYNMCYTWDGIYKRSFILDNKILHNESPGASYQDTGFRFQFYAFANRVLFVNEPLYMLRRDNPDSSEKRTDKVFAICDEYDFIERFLEQHSESSKQLLAGFSYKRFTSYIWNLERIDEKSKLPFIQRFSDDFRRMEELGLLNRALFSGDQIQDLRLLIDTPLSFAADYVDSEKIKSLEQRLKKSRRENSNLKTELGKTRKQIQNMKQRKVFRLASALDKLPTSKHRKQKMKEHESNASISKRITPSESIIASLTSYPERIGSVSLAIKSLKEQSCTASKILLWLAREQFPSLEADLPIELLDLCDAQFSICWCDDIGPHKKYFYSMQENPGALIITFDDDIKYSSNTIERLYLTHLQFPKAICARRARIIRYTKSGHLAPYLSWDLCNIEKLPSMNLMATGAMGVLYPPESLPDITFSKNAIRETCLYGDDLWLKTMEYINGTPTVLSDAKAPINHLPGTQETALYHDNQMMSRNDQYLNLIIKELGNDYPNIWKAQ